MKKRVSPRAAKAYVPRPGSRLKKEDAQKIGEAAERLYEEHGLIRPADLVDIARPKTAPLHHLFDWNDRRAADKYRLSQARHLLASYEVTVEKDEEDIVVRGTFYVDSRSGYIPAGVVVTDTDMLTEVLESAKREARNWNQRYQHLRKFAEIAGVLDAIDHYILKAEKAEKAKKTA